MAISRIGQPPKNRTAEIGESPITISENNQPGLAAFLPCRILGTISRQMVQARPTIPFRDSAQERLHVHIEHDIN